MGNGKGRDRRAVAAVTDVSIEQSYDKRLTVAEVVVAMGRMGDRDPTYLKTFRGTAHRQVTDRNDPEAGACLALSRALDAAARALARRGAGLVRQIDNAAAGRERARKRVVIRSAASEAMADYIGIGRDGHSPTSTMDAATKDHVVRVALADMDTVERERDLTGVPVVVVPPLPSVRYVPPDGPDSLGRVEGTIPLPDGSTVTIAAMVTNISP